MFLSCDIGKPFLCFGSLKTEIGVCCIVSRVWTFEGMKAEIRFYVSDPQKRNSVIAKLTDICFSVSDQLNANIDLHVFVV